jgi:plasmid stabilization system protein ParE
MEYHVVLADSAKDDADSLYQWVIERAPLRGPEWFERLLDCLYSLNHSPGRCPLAPEATRSHREIRHLLYGKRRNVYRILFEIDE